jgi:4-alpha-glucanotransferase
MTTRAHRMPFGAEVQADHSIREPETGVFLPPAAYPALALAVIGSHDLPTLRGWWEERDLHHKEQLGLFPGPSEAARQRQMRHRDRIELLQALRSQGLLPPDGEPDIPALSRAAHAFLARTPSVLAMVQIDDLTDEADPVTVPATSDERPNWRRRLSMTLERTRSPTTLYRYCRDLPRRARRWKPRRSERRCPIVVGHRSHGQPTACNFTRGLASRMPRPSLRIWHGSE